MKELRIPKLFYEYLDHEYLWRFKEIDDYKGIVKLVDPYAQSALLRAFIPLLYAHWEGFIKNASEALVNFVSHRQLPCRQLSKNYIAMAVKKHLNTLESSSPNYYFPAIDFFLNELDMIAEINFKKAVNTESNLSSIVFEKIASSIGIDPSAFQTKYILIDKSLVKRRNQIAHGEKLDIELNDAFKLSDEIINLIRLYKTNLENFVRTESFLA